MNAPDDTGLELGRDLDGAVTLTGQCLHCPWPAGRTLRGARGDSHRKGQYLPVLSDALCKSGSTLLKLKLPLAHPTPVSPTKTAHSHSIYLILCFML